MSKVGKNNAGNQDKMTVRGPFGSLKTEYADDRFLTARETAEFLSVPYQSVLNMSSMGKLPYYKLGKRNRYLVSDLKQLLLSERRGPEGGAYGNKME